MSAEAKLESARKELLDLGLRNPLLNYRTLRARGLEIVEERPTDLYILLVQKNTAMAFLEQPDTAASNDELGQPDEGELAARYTDDNLQTPYDSATLQKRLLHTYYTARSYMEENGANVLYVALGMLSWYESESSDKKRRAPLILLPVLLDRGSASEKFRVAYTGEEISTNLSLEAKLRLDYGVQLPFITAGEELDIAAYFDAVAEAVGSQPRWSVEREAMALAFFSFSKLLMLNDLDPANWPADKNPAEHSIIQALLNEEGFIAPPLDNDTPIDQRLKLTNSHQVVDADSSQALAILDVNDGRNLVIQGPPGTGKSQTITNLIAEAVGTGKTVLFVSEKMAALEVVKRRLDGLGLGDAALELHSHKATKAAVVEELGRTMSLGQPKEQGLFNGLGDLIQVTYRLNDYATAMNTPIYNSGRTPYEAYGRLIQLKQRLEAIALPEAPALAMFGWTAAQYAQIRQQMGVLQEHFGRMGAPRQHPFYGSLRAESQPEDEGRIREIGQQTAESFSRLRTTTAELAQQFGLPRPQTITEVKEIIRAAQRLVKAPNLFALNIAHEAWYSHAPQITAALEAGERIDHLQREYDEWLIPAAWTQAVLDIRQPLVVHGNRALKFFSGEYRAAKNKLLGLCRNGLPETVTQQVELVDAILEVQGHQPTVKAQESLLAQLFGARWNGLENTKWHDMLDAGYWAVGLHKEVREGGYPTEILSYLAQGFDVDKRTAMQTAVGAATDALESYERHWRSLQQFALLKLLDETHLLGDHEQQLWRYVREAGRFGEWVAYQQMIHQQPVVDMLPLWPAIESWSQLGQHLVSYFDYLYFAQLVETTLKAKPILGNFEGQTQQTAVDLFQYLDAEFLRQNRYRLAHEHWAKLPKFTAGGQIGLLQQEVSKKRNHLPIRQLISEAGPAMQRLKPIFMMSPLSIAMYLPPDTLEFDLVIFDEASQVRPVEALGAILRGRQTVVVGDSRQLPPTTFFDRVLSSGSDNGSVDEAVAEDEFFASEMESSSNGFITASNESILDLFVAKGAPQRMLRWHYRSRHESLIAISNRAFYENRLILFPSPDAARREVGLKLRHLPDTVYDRGGTRTNAQEAQAVAEAVMVHARTSPELTLGVAAFSSAQREAIEEALERLRREQLESEHFFAAHPAEPFFVKNLENVQGDERDVVYISVGYGRDADGKVNLNFGPLNPAGGERRLNVLITRSRRRCEVFTNLTAEDIDLRRTQSEGIAALKAFLAFAESGELEELAPAIPRQTTIFEKVIGEALTSAGYEVVQEVGNNGVVVDVAVRDPRQPERYLLGIVSDGDNYGRALFARDRDRIQLAVLDGLGWHVQRVWSTAWVNAPRESAAQLVEKVKYIEAQRYTAELAPRTVPHVERYAAEPPIARVALPYTQSKLRVDLYKRPGWEPGEPVGKLISQDYYEYDTLTKQFTARQRSYNAIGLNRPMQVLTPRRVKVPNPDFPGTVYAKLDYYMVTGRFSVADPYVIFFHKGQRYYAYIDKSSGDVYTQLDEKERVSLVAADAELQHKVRVEAQWVAQIIQEKGPLHQAELERSLAVAANMGRRTGQVSDMATTAAQFAAELGLVEQQGEFWWPREMTHPPVRDRSKLPAVSRKLDYVSDTEIGEAVVLLVGDTVAVRPEEIVPAVQKLLGFGSLRQDNQQRILGVIAQLLSNGRLTVYGEEITLPTISGRRASELFIERLRLTIPPEPPKKKAEPLALSGNLPTFPAYQVAPSTGSVFHWSLLQADGQTLLGSWQHSQNKRLLGCGQWWRYDPLQNMFLPEVGQGLASQSRGCEDFPNDERLKGEKQLYGRLDYDIVDGTFQHNGYLTVMVSQLLRSDKKYRLWRDPDTGALCGRRRQPGDKYDKHKLGYWFSHAHVTFDPQSEQLIDVPSRNCRMLQEVVAVHPALSEAMRRNEQASLLRVVQAEGPVPLKVIAQRYAEGSRTKLTPTITKFAERVVAQAAEDGVVRVVDGFVWPTELKRPLVRNRAKWPKRLRQSSYIAPAEYGEALLTIIQAVPQATVKELPHLVGQALLNDNRLTGKAAQPVDEALEWLIAHDYVKQKDELLVVVKRDPIDWHTVHEQKAPAVEPVLPPITAAPYQSSRAKIELYHLADWSYVDNGRFMSQHYFPFNAESGRYQLDGRVPEKTVMADFQAYRESHAKLYYDSRFGRFYHHASRLDNRQVEVDEALEATVKEPLLSCIAQIVQEEGPLHEEELSRSFAQAAGRKSRSATMMQMLAWAVPEAAAQGLIEQEGAFLWPVAMQIPPVRHRGQLTNSSQQWAYVAAAEIAQGLMLLAESGRGYSKEELARAVAELVGLPAPKAADLERIEAVLRELEAAQFIREEDGIIGRVKNVVPLLTLRETAKLAELITQDENPAPENEALGSGVVVYQMHQQPFDLYALEGWRKVEDGLLESQHLYRYDPEAAQFVVAEHYTLAQLHEGREALIGFEAEVTEWRSRPYARLRFDLVTGELRASVSYWLVTSSKLYPAWRDPAEGVFYTITQENESDDFDRRYEPLTGAVTALSEPHRLATEGYMPVQGEAALRHSVLQAAVDHVAEIVLVEQPVHVEEVAQRLVEAAALADRRIAEQIIQQAVAAGVVVKREQFLWLAGQIPELKVRHRAHLPVAARQIRYVSEPELELAILHVVVQAQQIDEKGIKQALLPLLSIAPLTTVEHMRVNETLRRMAKQGFLVRVQKNKLAVAEAERFLDDDGLPTVVVAPEIWQAIWPYERSTLKINDLYRRSGWYSHTASQLWSERYYRFDPQQWRFEFDWITVDQETFSDIGNPKSLPGPGQIYGQLCYDLLENKFYGRAYNFFIQTEQQEKYRVSIDSAQKRFYVRVMDHKEKERLYWYDLQGGDPEAITYMDIHLRGMDDKVTADIDSMIEGSMREVDVERVTEIVRAEGPIHERELVRRFAEAAGLSAQNKIAKVLVQHTVAFAVQRRQLRQQGDFLTLPQSQEIVVRSRSELPAVSRQVALVGEEELAAAVLLVLKQGSHLRVEHIAAEVGKVLGVRPFEPADEQRLAQLMLQLLGQGKVGQVANFWVVV